MFSATAEPQAAVNTMMALCNPQGCVHDEVTHETPQVAETPKQRRHL